MIEEWTTTTSEKEYRRLAQELFDFQAENLFVVRFFPLRKISGSEGNTASQESG